jgi:hypothetical protein
MKDRPEPRRITKNDGNAREDGRIYIRTVAREHKRQPPKVNALGCFKLSQCLGFSANFVAPALRRHDA